MCEFMGCLFFGNQRSEAVVEAVSESDLTNWTYCKYQRWDALCVPLYLFNLMASLGYFE